MVFPEYNTLLAFSIYKNAKKLFKTSKKFEQFKFFDWLNVLSMFWVIMYHRYDLFVFMMVVNGTEHSIVGSHPCFDLPNLTLVFSGEVSDTHFIY